MINDNDDLRLKPSVSEGKKSVWLRKAKVGF